MGSTPVIHTLKMNEKGALELEGAELVTGTRLEVEHEGHWETVRVETVRRPGVYVGVMPNGQTIELQPGMRAVIEPRTTTSPM